MITCFPVIENDPISIKEIYDYYILNSTATFHREKITIPGVRNFCLLATGSPGLSSGIGKSLVWGSVPDLARRDDRAGAGPGC
jgi:hypothetical protein